MRPFAVVGGVLRGGVVHLLEHPGHRHHDRRLEHREHRHQILDVTAEPDDDLVVEGTQGQCAGQHVCQRQENQQPLTLAQQRRQNRLGTPGFVDEVGMGQLAALGAPGGTRRVDQRRRIFTAQRFDAGGQLGRVDRGAILLELLEGFAARTVDLQHAPQLRQVTGELGDHRRVGVRLGERDHRCRVGQHPAHLLGRRRLVDRDGDRAYRQDRQIEDRPLVAGGGKDSHPVAGLHP